MNADLRSKSIIQQLIQKSLVLVENVYCKPMAANINTQNLLFSHSESFIQTKMEPLQCFRNVSSPLILFRVVNIRITEGFMIIGSRYLTTNVHTWHELHSKNSPHKAIDKQRRLDVHRQNKIPIPYKTLKNEQNTQNVFNNRQPAQIDQKVMTSTKIGITSIKFLFTSEIFSSIIR